ncbi:MAG: hypothetical protein MHPSP_000775 [Paramarteilia canceri]
MSAEREDAVSLEKLRIVDLRAVLKFRSLPINGNKNKLAERLREALSDEQKDPETIKFIINGDNVEEVVETVNEDQQSEHSDLETHEKENISDKKINFFSVKEDVEDDNVDIYLQEDDKSQINNISEKVLQVGDQFNQEFSCEDLKHEKESDQCENNLDLDKKENSKKEESIDIVTDKETVPSKTSRKNQKSTSSEHDKKSTSSISKSSKEKKQTYHLSDHKSSTIWISKLPENMKLKDVVKEIEKQFKILKYRYYSKTGSDSFDFGYIIMESEDVLKQCLEWLEKNKINDKKIDAKIISDEDHIKYSKLSSHASSSVSNSKVSPKRSSKEKSRNNNRNSHRSYREQSSHYNRNKQGRYYDNNHQKASYVHRSYSKKEPLLNSYSRNKDQYSYREREYSNSRDRNRYDDYRGHHSKRNSSSSLLGQNHHKNDNYYQEDKYRKNDSRRRPLYSMNTKSSDCLLDTPRHYGAHTFSSGHNNYDRYESYNDSTSYDQRYDPEYQYSSYENPKDYIYNDYEKDRSQDLILKQQDQIDVLNQQLNSLKKTVEADTRRPQDSYGGFKQNNMKPNSGFQSKKFAPRGHYEYNSKFPRGRNVNTQDHQSVKRGHGSYGNDVSHRPSKSEKLDHSEYSHGRMNDEKRSIYSSYKPNYQQQSSLLSSSSNMPINTSKSSNSSDLNSPQYQYQSFGSSFNQSFRQPGNPDSIKKLSDSINRYFPSLATPNYKQNMEN